MNIQLPVALGSSKLQTTQRLDGATTVDVQHVMAANPLPLISGNITSAVSSVVGDVTDAGMIAFQVTGTYAGVNLAFEVSINGTDWFSVFCLRADKSALEATSGVLTANTSRAWVCDVNGFRQFRVRSTAWTSGTAAIAIAPSPSSMEMDPYVTLAAGANTIGNVGLVAGSQNIGNVGLTAGSQTIGNVGIGVKTTGGATPGKLISAATTNSTLVKGSAGTLYSLHATNNSASWRYLKLYNKGIAPTVGSDAPVMTVGLPPASSIPVALPEAIGQAFASGIGLAITGVMSDADATAIGANEVAVSYTFA